jgi:hypothetical protein
VAHLGYGAHANLAGEDIGSVDVEAVHDGEVMFLEFYCSRVQTSRTMSEPEP